MTHLRIADEADEQIQRIERWWRANRTKAPQRFSEELADALEAITATPLGGQSYRVVGRMRIRRVLLATTRYHLYFSYDETSDLIEVRAVWHCARERGPDLTPKPR